MDEKEVRQLLKELDLNEYEIRTYLTLIKRGALTAGELATLSKVPQPRIYDVIRTLMSKGFVTTSGGRPKKVVPVNPERVLNAMQKSYIEKISLLKKELERMYHPSEELIGNVMVVKSKITLEEYIKTAIRNAKLHLSIAVPISFLGKIKEELEAKKNATVHLFVYGKGEVPPIAPKIKLREVPDPLIIIQDKDMGIYVPNEAMASSGSTLHGYGLIVRDNNLLFMFDRYFYHALWPTGKTVYEEKKELELPKEYIHIRQLVEDIRSFNLVGAEIEIFGKFVHTKEPIHIEGIIEDFFEDSAKVVSNITVRTKDGKKYVVGGWNASLEDIEADRLILKG
ncbi:hypothetical protein PAP_05180 [Palaeococcus pacificus DY20341]|uniref:TrmB family transcriptional regulator n=1 Tax=Palaeococcus pacificus DY20341 TaxID=1343739 RepID=A0A075LU01_9EURY|nr:TrmB family transcriptional regulator [Palaeococcus pacificus]AIF69447.1 hypothetical protein PAP_05180 [Palaeococcus pacificus DY20341]